MTDWTVTLVYPVRCRREARRVRRWLRSIAP